MKSKKPRAVEGARGEDATPKRRVGVLRRAGGALVFLIVGLIGALPYLAQTRIGTDLVARALSATSGHRVQMDGLEVGYWRGPIRVEGLSVGEFLRVQTVELVPDLVSLRQRRLQGLLVLDKVEVYPDRYEPPPPRPLSESVPAPWEIGDLTILVDSRMPSLRGNVVHREGEILIAAEIEELALPPPLARIAGMRLRGALTVPELLGDLQAWQGKLRIAPMKTEGESVVVGLGSTVRAPTLLVSLEDGALRIEEADAIVDGRQLSIDHAELVGDHLRVDLAVDGNFEVVADFTGLPELTALDGWRQLRQGGDPRALLSSLTGGARVRLGEHEIDGHTLRDLEIDLRADGGVVTLDRFVGMAEGIAFAATGSLDARSDPPLATLRLASPATFVVEALTGISAEDLRLEANLVGVPPWTPADEIRLTGRLDVGHVAIVDFDMEDLGFAFAGVGSSFTFEGLETVITGGHAVTGHGALDLARSPESLVCDLRLPAIDLPGLGESAVEARVTVQGESYLSFDPVRIVSRGADDIEQVVTGNAGIDPMADSRITFSVGAERLQLHPDLPAMLDVVAGGFVDDLGEQRGRAKVRIGTWPLGEDLPLGDELTDLAASIAFDTHGVRCDQVSARLDGEKVTGRGDLTRGDDEHELTLQAELHLDAHAREGLRLEGITGRAHLTGDDRADTPFEGGTLELSVATGSIGAHRLEALELTAELAPEELRVQSGQVRLDGEMVEFSGQVALGQDVLPARLVARAGRARIEGATLDGLSARIQVPDLRQLGVPEALRASGDLQVDSVSMDQTQLTAVRGQFSVADGMLTSREVAFQYAEGAATAALEVDLRTTPVGVLTTLRLASLPFGASDLRNLEVVARLAGEAIDVRSVSATWGEFTMRGGGRFSLPTGARGSRTISMRCTLGMEHPILRGITVTADLRGLAVDQAAQRRLAGDVTVNVREVAVLGDVLNDFRVVARAEAGVFTTSELGARWGTGDLSGRGSFDTSHEVATYQLALTASKVPVNSNMGQPLGFVLPIFSGKESAVTGSLDAQLQVRGQGLTRADLDRHLTGGGSAYVREGKMNGSPVLGVVSGWHGLSGTTNFTADTSFRIAGGKVSTARDLVMRSNQDLLTMKGSVDFDRTIDYEGKVKALGGHISPEIAPFTSILARDGFLPFRLTGTLENPSFELAPLDKLLERVILDPRTWLDLFGK